MHVDDVLQQVIKQYYYKNCLPLLLTHTVKRNLEVSLSFMVMAMILTAVAVVLLFPLWHMGVFLAGGILALVACKNITHTSEHPLHAHECFFPLF